MNRFELYALYAAGLSLLAILLLGIALAWMTTDELAEATSEQAAVAPPAHTVPAAVQEIEAAPLPDIPRPIPRPSRG